MVLEAGALAGTETQPRANVHRYEFVAHRLPPSVFAVVLQVTDNHAQGDRAVGASVFRPWWRPMDLGRGPL